MSTHQEQHELIIWTGHERADLIARVLGSMPNLKPLATGAPKRASIAPFADSLDIAAYDDLRKMLIDHPSRYLLLGTNQGVSLDTLKLAAKQHTHILALDPPLDDLNTLPEDKPNPSNPNQPWWTMLPCWNQSPAWLAAADPEEVLGEIQSMSIVTLTPPEANSLYARLYDAFHLIHQLAGNPIIIDATIKSPLGSPPKKLTELTGHITCMIKLKDNRTATIHASDTSTVWTRRVNCLSNNAQLELTDHAYHLYQSETDENELKQHEESTVIEESNQPDPASLIQHQWNRIISHQSRQKIIDPRHIIASCHAALLSARTGAQESPQSMLRISGI